MRGSPRLIAVGVVSTFSLATTCSAHADSLSPLDTNVSPVFYDWMWGLGAVIVVIVVYLLWKHLVRAPRNSADSPKPKTNPKGTSRPAKTDSRSDH